MSITGTPVGQFNTKDVATASTVSYTGLSLTGASAGNYSLTNHPDGTYSITPRTITISAPTIATREYDGTKIAGAVTVGTVTGLVSPETLTVTATGADYSSANAGTYTGVVVTHNVADGSNGGVASNYSTLSNATATAIVSRKAITITADAMSKDYGTADPTFTYVVSPSITGLDALSGLLSRVAGTDAGTYAIQQNTLVDANNP
ncbi:MAG: hypothetical protein EBT21_08265, partial [Actinobacteria bacterium]|nr:hypothetical protein [Actinomycetota bacterium]